MYETYVLDSPGNPLDNINITFNINGEFYTRSAHNDVTGKSSSATEKVLPTLKGNNLNTNFQDGSKYESIKY